MRNSFEFGDVDGFDQHINGSIPTFSELNSLINRICYDYAQEGTFVLDLGCTTNRLIHTMEKRDNVQYIGVDKSDAQVENPTMHFTKADITQEFHMPQTSVVTMLFTLQFLPPHTRKTLLKTIIESLVEGGVFLIAEKTHFPSPRMEMSLQGALTEHKRAVFTDKEIVDKQISLTPVMKQEKDVDFEQSLYDIDGVKNVSVIWCWGGFKCYAVTKD